MFDPEAFVLGCVVGLFFSFLYLLSEICRVLKKLLKEASEE